jgi:HD-GYP domain-containing protein (c-di-GMP phosphodiesterase class II)
MSTDNTTEAVLKAAFAMYETPGSPSSAGPQKDLVTAKLEDLIEGRALRYPLYNASGALLLAEGTTLTNDFKRMSEARNIHTVLLHRDDLSRLTFQGSEEQSSQNTQLDDALVERLDKIVDSGIMFVVNSESALLSQITHHGCKSYQREKFLERIDRNKETSIFVDNLMRNALRGKKINSNEVMRLAANYLDDITSDIDSTLAAKLDAIKQSEISDHCVGMTILGMAVGVEMGMDAQNVRTIAMAGLIHDWGMASVPQEIRDAPRHLTESEFYEIMKHPMYTQRMLERMCGVSMPVPLICYQVHERPNGGGYPQGRLSDRIHPMAKILAVTDAYNALISPRPFRPPLTPYAAMECILRQTAAGDFDAHVVRALLMVQSLFPIGSYVALSDGSVARVLRRNGNKFSQPIIKIVQDNEGKNVPDDAETAVIDLSASDLKIIKSIPNPGTNAIQLSQEILQWRSWGKSNAASDMESSSGILQNIAETASSGKIQASAQSLISLEQYSPELKWLASQAINLLEGANKMTNVQYGVNRQYPRTVLKSVVTLRPVDGVNPFSNLQSGISFQVLTFDVSQGGVSFIYPEKLSLDNLLVGLHVSEGKKAWFFGKIARCREIGDTNFWLHSVAFQQRVTA